MQIAVKTDWTVGDLIDYQQEGSLRVNHEYQRGLRWTASQNQMFIDSIFRGYSIPAFYFHKTTATRSKNIFFDIVDGQQRINAINSFSEGAFVLPNPTDEAGFKFPAFMKNAPCPWGGKRFPELPEPLQENLKNHNIVVYEITTDSENSIRDLFIRLQGGTPLTPQDKRDSWPGYFTEFVLTTGGKSGVERWYGHPLFTEVAKVSSESRRRQLVAQIFMLYWTVQKENKFCDIKSSNIDEFYHSQVDFDDRTSEAENFLSVCQKLYEAFHGKPKLVGHYLIHLFLLVNHLSKEYTRDWEHHLAGKWHEFESRRQQAAENVKNNRESGLNRYYYRYGHLTQTQADIASSIRQRHAFFVEEMLELLSPRKLDTKRSFTDIERQTVFFRDMEICQWCRMKGSSRRVSWDECDIHHVVPYAQGGLTEIYNAVLVHRECHPKSPADTKEFLDWRTQAGATSADLDVRRPRRGSKRIQPPDGTKVRFSFGEKVCFGEFLDGKVALSVNGEEKHCNSLSDASREITGTSRNGWRDWYFCLPGNDLWILADDWRKEQQGISNPTKASRITSPQADPARISSLGQPLEAIMSSHCA